MLIKMDCPCGASFMLQNDYQVVVPDEVKKFIEAHKDCCMIGKPRSGEWILLKKGQLDELIKEKFSLFGAGK